MAFRVEEIQSTPNPNALKITLDRLVSEQPISFLHAEAAADHPLAKCLFSIPGVCSLFLLNDFITINKSPDAPWADITRRVRQVLAEN